MLPTTMSHDRNIIGLVADEWGRCIPVTQCTKFKLHYFLEYGWAYVFNLMQRRLGEFRINWQTGKMDWFPNTTKQDSCCDCHV